MYTIYVEPISAQIWHTNAYKEDLYHFYAVDIFCESRGPQ
jgi:hypothetical protein